MKILGYSGVGAGENCSNKNFNGLTNNQYLWSHFSPSEDIQMALEEKESDHYVILNYRDPRDVLVSWFYWMHPKHGGEMHLHQEYMRKVYKNFSDEELMDFFIRIDKFRKNEYNPLEQYYFCRSLLFHPKVHKVRFEDLVGENGGGDKQVQAETVRGILNYLEVSDNEDYSLMGNIYDTNSQTFRQGKIGSYRDELSTDQLKLFKDLHGMILSQYNYPLDH